MRCRASDAASFCGSADIMTALYRMPPVKTGRCELTRLFIDLNWSAVFIQQISQNSLARRE